MSAPVIIARLGFPGIATLMMAATPLAMWGCAQCKGAESAEVPAREPQALIHEGKLPPGYRDWRVISVAHEAGALDDLRAVLGNDVAIQATGKGRPSSRTAP